MLLASWKEKLEWGSEILVMKSFIKKEDEELNILNKVSFTRRTTLEIMWVIKQTRSCSDFYLMFVCYWNYAQVIIISGVYSSFTLLSGLVLNYLLNLHSHNEVEHKKVFT